MYNLIVQRKLEEEHIKKAKKGKAFLKHGRRGKPHIRYFFISDDMSKIVWRENKKTNARKAEHTLADFSAVQKNYETKVLKRSIPKSQRPKRIKLCFSFVSDKRTLDIECKDEEECEKWYEIFTTALRKSKEPLSAEGNENATNNRKSLVSSGARKAVKAEDLLRILKKFSFDVEGVQWKYSKILTKNAKFMDDDFMYLGLSLDGNPCLKQLDLTELVLNENAALYLSTGFSTAQVLTQITLCGCSISDEGGKQLCSGLRNNQSITHINLSNNSLSDGTAAQFAKILSMDKVIVEINMDKNQIGDEGALALAESLRDNASLVTLGLNENEISNRGAQALAEVLSLEHNVFKILKLAKNNIQFPTVKADPDDFSLEISLFLAVDQNNYKDVILLLLKGANPNVQNEDDGKTPIHLASLRGDMQLVQFLLDHPSLDINARDDGGETPIFTAFAAKQNEIVKVLLEKKADFKQPDNHKKTIIHLAAEQGNLAMLKLLVEQYKDDIRKVTDEDITPLHLAAQNQHQSVVEWLVAQDAKDRKSGVYSSDTAYVNWKDSLGETALHKALPQTKPDLEIAKILVKHGGDVSIEDHHQRTPISDVSAEIRELLLKETRIYNAHKKS